MGNRRGKEKRNTGRNNEGEITKKTTPTRLTINKKQTTNNTRKMHTMMGANKENNSQTSGEKIKNIHTAKNIMP